MKNISTKNYPYGKVNKRLQQTVDWLNSHKKKFVTEIPFDYPEYWGCPKSLSYKLDADEVDFLQDETNDWIQDEKEY